MQKPLKKKGGKAATHATKKSRVVNKHGKAGTSTKKGW